MSESRKYRRFTAPQKLDIVLAGLRGDRTVEACRDHHKVAETQQLRLGDPLQTVGGLGVRQRVARSRELVAEGHSPSLVARIALISRQPIYQLPKTVPAVARRSRPPADDVEAAISTSPSKIRLTVRHRPLQG